MKKSKVLFFIVILLASCTINKRITYDTTHIDKVAKSSLSKVILDIEPLEDVRKNFPSNQILFESPRQTKVKGETSCINAEEHYKKEPAPLQITNMICEHFNAKSIYQDVITGRRDSSDFFLTGKLKSYYGRQKFSSAAAVGAQFGLIGALATANVKTKGEISIELQDLKLFNKKGKLIKDFGTVAQYYDEDLPADAYCWCIFDNLNAKLKVFTEELSKTVESEIKKSLARK